MHKRFIPLVFSFIALALLIFGLQQARPVAAEITMAAALHATFGEVSAESPSSQTVLADIESNFSGTHAQPPIVLVHGWQGANIGLECQRHDNAYVDENWDKFDEYLENLGFHVELARLYSGGATSATGPGDPDFECTPVAQKNVPYLIEAIDAAIAATGQDKVILVSHSMGGLVSRAYIEGTGYRNDVVALYTLGTPNIGVPVGALSAWVEALTLGIINLDDYCLAQQIVCQFSDNTNAIPAGFESIEEFNAEFNTRAEGVYYHMVGGDINFDLRSLLCDPIYLIIGFPNDCIVPTDSAMGVGSANGSLGPLTGAIDRLQVTSAHISLFSDTPSIGCDYTYNFHDKNYYCTGSLQEELASNSMTDCIAPTIDSRTGDHICGTVSSLSSRAASAGAPQTAVKSATKNGAVAKGSTAVQTVDIAGGLTVFTVFANAPVLVVLVGPDGVVVDPANDVDSNAILKQSERGVGITLENAQAGEWQVMISADNATKYLTFAVSDPTKSLSAIQSPSAAPSTKGTLETDTVSRAPTPQIDESAHTCTIDNTGPYQSGDMVNLECDFTVTDEDKHIEWIDFYFIDAPDAWNPTTLSAPPADAGGWGRVMAADKCNDTGVSYWGIDNPFLDPVADECSLRADNLPISGSHNGPWMAFGGSDITFGPEGFEGAFPPAGWQMIQTENPGDRSDGWVKSSAQAASGSSSAFHDDVSNCTFCFGDFESWLIMPPYVVHAGDKLHWAQYLSGGNGGFAPDYDLRISLGSSNPNDDDYVEILDFDMARNEWTFWQYDMTEYTGQQIYIAFRYYGDDDQNFWLDQVFIDNAKIADTTYEFDATYEVAPTADQLCPGSSYVGLSSDSADTQSSLQALAMGDLVDFSTNIYNFTVASACPEPAVGLDVTVSTSGACPGTANTNVFFDDQEVTYCFTLTNNSADVTMLTHDISTTQTANLSPTLTILPGATTTISQTVTLNGNVNDCIDNAVEWTAETASGLGQPQGSPADVPFITSTYSDLVTGTAEVCIDMVPAAVTLNQTSALAGSNAILPLVAVMVGLIGMTLFIIRRKNLR